MVSVEERKRVELIHQTLLARLGFFNIRGEAASFEVLFITSKRRKEVSSRKSQRCRFVAIFKRHMQAVLLLVIVIIKLVKRLCI